MTSNLLSNAIDASKAGGKISIRCTSTGDRFSLSIEDSGGGVPAHLLDQIFTPFFTTKKDVGTGLGLWITKDIVEKYGGSISVVNTDDGALFEIVLPTA